MILPFTFTLNFRSLISESPHRANSQFTAGVDKKSAG